MNFNRIFDYTKALSLNNNRTWFHDNHKQYEEAQADFLFLIDQLRYVLMQEAPALGDSIMFTPAKAFMYRIPRDMRYSKNKEPYNPAFRAYFSPDKKEFLPFGYFVYISAERCSIGTGAYPWEAKQLNTLREYIACNFEELDAIVAENGLDVYGKELKRCPRGYDENHPAGEWLKYKRFLVNYRFSGDELKDFDSFTDAAAEAVRRFEPLRKFLNDAFTGPTDDIDEFDIY